MSTPCSCVAGLRIALEMERRGRSLYLRAAQFAREESLRALLLELADEELEHHTVFSAMLEALGAPPLSPEENALAAARAADVFFPGGLMQIAQEGELATQEHMLEAAIQAERDSIDFYERLMDSLPADGRDAIAAIVQEERGHLRALTARK